MAKSSFDPDGYQRLQNDYEKVMAAFGDLYQNITGSAVSDYIQNYRGGSELQRAVERVKATQQKAIDMESILQKYYEMMTGTLEEGNRNMSSVDTPDAQVPKFSEMEVSSKSERYSGYISYEWNWQNFDFARDYSDIYSFMNSAGYKYQNNMYTGRSEWSNKELYIQYFTGHIDDYTDELLENALMSTLDTMAGSMASAKGLNDEIKAKAGKNYDTIINELSKLIENTLKEGGTKEQLFASEDFKQICEGFDYQLGVPLKTLIDKSWNNINGMFKTGATIITIMNYLDPAIKAIVNVTADYTNQLSYLDTMQDALLAAGYPYGPVQKIINSAREKYAEPYERFISDFTKVCEKAAYDKSFDLAGALSPEFKVIDKTIGYIAKEAKLVHASDIAADKALMGLKQYDAVLTNTYEKYQKMISDGVASQADMKEADRIFRILCTTKQQEYKNMMTMCSKGSADYQKFQRKYNELTEWLKKANQ